MQNANCKFCASLPFFCLCAFCASVLFLPTANSQQPKHFPVCLLFVYQFPDPFNKLSRNGI